MAVTTTEWLGYAAAGLVLATFAVRRIETLRTAAIASNVLFIAYAACAGLSPVLLLHALLLPLNIVRLREARRARHGPSEGSPSDGTRRRRSAGWTPRRGRRRRAASDTAPGELRDRPPSPAPPRR